MDKTQAVILIVLITFIGFYAPEEVAVGFLVLFIIAFGVALTIKWLEFQRKSREEARLVVERNHQYFHDEIAQWIEPTPCSLPLEFSDNRQWVEETYKRLVELALADDRLVGAELEILDDYINEHWADLPDEVVVLQGEMVLALSGDEEALAWVEACFYDYIGRPYPAMKKRGR